MLSFEYNASNIVAFTSWVFLKIKRTIESNSKISRLISENKVYVKLSVQQ